MPPTLTEPLYFGRSPERLGGRAILERWAVSGNISARMNNWVNEKQKFTPTQIYAVLYHVQTRQETSARRLPQFGRAVTDGFVCKRTLTRIVGFSEKFELFCGFRWIADRLRILSWIPGDTELTVK